jgi:hypothetical protein
VQIELDVRALGSRVPVVGVGDVEHSVFRDEKDVVQVGQHRHRADHGGLLLLLEVDRWMGLTDAINECIPDPRVPLLTVHQQCGMIARRSVSIALRYEDLNDQQVMRDDPVLQLAVGKSPDPELSLASLSSWRLMEHRAGWRTALTAGQRAKMSTPIVEVFS